MLESIEDGHRKKNQEFYIILMNQVCNVENGLKLGRFGGEKEKGTDIFFEDKDLL